MHRACIPSVHPGQFKSHYGPTLEPGMEELRKHGHQTMFYAERNWDDHLEDFNRFLFNAQGAMEAI